MEKEYLYELIESYLDHTLPEDRQREVEQRIAEDEDFRQEVSLHRELQQRFGDPDRERLRTALAEIMEEPESPAGKRFAPSKAWLAGAALIVALLLTGFGIWRWSQPAEPLPPAPVERKPVEPPASPDQKSPNLESPAPPPAVPKIAPAPPAKPKTSAAQPVAANFTPNPALEALIGNDVRSESLALKITSPGNDSDFAPDEKGETQVRFAGTMERVSEDVPEAAFVLAVFNNKDAVTPLLTLPLEGKKDAAGKLLFDLRQRLALPSGLYYFTVEQEGAVRGAGKFTIGKKRR